MTNREIAAELAVTVKAVEWHLSNVYRKLEDPRPYRPGGHHGPGRLAQAIEF